MRLILGRSDLPAEIDFADPNAADFTLFGGDSGDEAGISVRGAGDINGDGLHDIIIGARFADSFNNSRPDAGEAYIVFGNSLFAPAVPIITGPIAGARLTETATTITWNESADAASYELWLQLVGGDANPVVNTLTQDTFAEVSGLEIGRYRSWVRAIRSDSTKSAWASATFSVSLSTTIHYTGAGNQEDLRPTFSWDAVDGATGYRVYISNVTQQQNAIVDTVVTDTHFTPDFDLQFGINRIWVQPMGPGNYSGAWSTAEDYSVGPQLISPVTATLNNPPVFSWTDVPGADTYEIYIRKSGDAPLIATALTEPTYTPSGTLANGDYRWWVRGVAANGRTGSWSSAGTFNVGGRVTITSPTENVANGIANIRWEAVQGAAAYEVYLYSSTESRLIQRVTDVTATQFDSIPLAEGDYRVWVRAYAASGSAAPWSRATDFSVASLVPELTATAASPVTPTLESIPEFSWNAASQAASYNLYLTDGESVIQQSGLSTTQWTPSSQLASGIWTAGSGRRFFRANRTVERSGNDRHVRKNQRRAARTIRGNGDL
ncbi:MAG: hypothetical protein R3C49_11080 [Planctomycetaceae bacterium]